MNNRQFHLRGHHDVQMLRAILRERMKHAPLSANELLQQDATLGEHLADRISAIVGSWRFIAFQSCLLTLWLVINSLGWALHWDPYPFILLNLVLSFQAAFTAPVIMMSQNRQASRDRVAAEIDIEVNRVAAAEVVEIQEILELLTTHHWPRLLEHLEEHRRILEEIRGHSTPSNAGDSLV